jgi:ribonuclease VapC
VTARVLDSWALLGWLQGEEPARAKVREILESASRGETAASMSMMNVGEVFYLIAKRRGAAMAERFLSELPVMPLQTFLPDRKVILGAARLKSRFPISYADAFAVETARQQKAALVTGDPELFELAKHEPVELVWVGSRRPH